MERTTSRKDGRGGGETFTPLTGGLPSHLWVLERPDGTKGRASEDKGEYDAFEGESRAGVAAGAGMAAGVG